MDIPSPRDCIGIIGVAIGFLSGIIGLYLVLFANVTPWGFIVLAISGWVSFSSVFYCVLWEWERM